jgi:DNA adenine methylase
MKIKPIIQWAGGKTKMLKHYKTIIPTSGFTTYVEPFFGGGAVFLWMKENNPNIRYIINDVNDELMNV